MSGYQIISGRNEVEWPYTVQYGRETEVSADVLIIGGGIAGCHAAINAARRGARVAVVDKGPVIRSGSGGAGVDHWHAACTNPCSKVTPEEMMEAVQAFGGYGTREYGNGITCYILCKESYDTLFDVEQMGVKVRDVDDEFAGAEFRDDETKLMFAYDYENKHCIRIQGANIKPALYHEMKRLGIAMYDRIMATSLLTQGGKPGARVVGATGVDVRTGEFYIFEAKATVLTCGSPSGLWVFSSELQGFAHNYGDPNNAGDGAAMAWRAGVECTLMERSGRAMGGPLAYPRYGIGNAGNTWYPCTMADANGKEIPWVDRDGRALKTVSERCHPAPGQRLTIHGPDVPYELLGANLIPDLPERIKNGEYALPLFADLPGMPRHERRAIFGLMVGHEGKTRIPIYDVYTRAGFDPDRDMLEARGAFGMGIRDAVAPQWREAAFGSGGAVVIDWDLKTNLEGLYAAGTQTASGGDHAQAATSGRYAGRKAVACAQTVAEPAIDRRQVDEEKARVYAPLRQRGDVGWKELQAGICRIMQDYCGEYKSEETLRMGLRWLNSIRESEAARTCVGNPHELMRVLDCLTRITVAEMIVHASLARKASSALLDFKRIDYPEVDPPEWDKFVTTRLENGEVKVGELPFDYWLRPPNAPTYQENYAQHCGL